MMKIQYVLRVPKFTAVLLLCFWSIEAFAGEWEQSFAAGQPDVNGQYMGGSEVLHLVGHKGKLFAAVGYWMDARNIYYGGSDPTTGWAQILRLDSPDGTWQVDLEMGEQHLRPEILKEITFTTDGSGALLDGPVTLLIACAHSAVENKQEVHAFTLNDATGEWMKSVLYSGPKPGGPNYSVRDLHVHRDTVTGIDRVFATFGMKGIFSGVYDPAEPGLIKWDDDPEMGPVATRPLSIIEANGSLMFSSGPFVYERIDGERASYRIAHDLSDLTESVHSPIGGIRGLTSIPNPNGPGESLLFVWNPSTLDAGEIYRLDPDGEGGYSRHLEIRIAELMSDYLDGEPVYFILGAYNEFLPAPNAQEDSIEYLVGFESALGRNKKHPLWIGRKPGGKIGRFYRGAMYAVRGANQKYRLEEVNGRIQADDPALVATRCYVRSPFPGEEAIYFGGHDGNLIISTNQAWIFKKKLALTR